MTQLIAYGIANNTKTTNYLFTIDITISILETTAELVYAVTNQKNTNLDELINIQTETLATFQRLLNKSSPANNPGSTQHL